MPRQPRIDLPGIAQHVIQLGNDRQPCFFTEADYQKYCAELRELALQADVAIHAYVLMTHHVHLLTTPADSRNQGQSGVIRGPARMNSDRPRSGPETAL